MPSYSAPTPEQIKTWTGVNVSAVGLTAEQLGTLLDELLVNAEAEVAQICGESRFDSSGLTERQAATLAEAVACGVGSRFLSAPQVMKATGTQRPLLAERSEEIADTAADLARRSRNLANLIANGPATGNAQVLSSSTRPGRCRPERSFGRGRELG